MNKFSVNKSELIAAVAERGDIPKAEAARNLEAVLDAIQSALANGKSVRITGFGNFIVKDRKERTGRNPQTGEEIVIEAAKVVRFSPGKETKMALNS